jgi:phage repressor protein C with HTH and peptisase S24 domain
MLRIVSNFSQVKNSMGHLSPLGLAMFDATRDDSRDEKAAKSLKHMELRNSQKQWLAAARDHSKLSLTEISRRAYLSPGALSRFMNDETRAQLLSTPTIAAVAEVTRYPTAATLLGASHISSGFREEEAVAFQGESNDPISDTIANLINSPNRFAYMLQSDALIYEGYKPGDIVIVDMSTNPRDGDIVCVQFYARNEEERTQTVFRLLSRRYLIAASPYNPTREPREILDASTKIMGTVIASIRKR